MNAGSASLLSIGSLLALLAPAAAQTATMPNPSPSPPENRQLPDQDVLGKLLFWEEQLSFDNTVACGTCHLPEHGGSDPRLGVHPGPDRVFGNGDDVVGSPGVVRQEGRGRFVHEALFFPRVQVTDRRAPTAINAGGGFSTMFWDGRATGEFRDPISNVLVIKAGGALESQAAAPPTSEVEMGAAGYGWADIAAKIARVRPLALASNLPPDMAAFASKHATYPDMFRAVYGSPEVTPVKIVFAIANYERTLVSDRTVVDDWLHGRIAKLPARLQPGFDLFAGRARCDSCHPLPFTHDDDFHNLGVTREETDPGRFAITANEDDKGKFKTTNVRNAKLRVPLFHNGGMKSLAELIEFYDRGGDHQNPHLDSEMVPTFLSAQEKQQLLVFLEDGLTDPRVAARQHPFTRPTLRSERPPLNTVYGVASRNGKGRPMDVIAHLPANTGNFDWLLGVANATPDRPAVAALATVDDPNGTPLTPAVPVPANIDPRSAFAFLQMTTDATGVATLKLPIPARRDLAGFRFYCQFFVVDPGAVATGGLYGSQGVGVTIF